MTNQELADKAQIACKELIKCYYKTIEAIKQNCLAYADGVKGKKLKMLKDKKHAMEKLEKDCVAKLFEFCSSDIRINETGIYITTSSEIKIVSLQQNCVSQKQFIDAIKDHGCLKIEDFKPL